LKTSFAQRIFVQLRLIAFYGEDCRLWTRR
jgi:hypothetical protein